MSRATEIVIGTTRQHPDPHGALRALVGMTGAVKVSIASRSVGESREYETFAAIVRGEADEEEDDRVLLGYDLGVAEVPGHYVAGTCLHLDVGGCTLSKSLRAAVRENIAADTLGEFSLNGIFIDVGDHDLYEVDEEDEPHRIGRYFASLTFWGYGTPNDPGALEEQVAALGPFRQALSRFEAEFGPAEVSLVMRI